MMPLGQWLRPPRTLLLALFLVTLIAVSALAWFGTRLLDQERVVEAQRTQERQEQSADRIAANAREALAETGERLGSWLLNPPPDGKPAEGVLVLVNGSGISAVPPHRLLYTPTSTDEAIGDDEMKPDAFTEGEALEFQQGQLAEALESYKRLVESPIPGVRAGALLRMARVLRKLGRIAEARVAYARLASVPNSRIAGVPADLTARLALSELSGSSTDARELQEALLARRWSLSRGQFEFYWSEALQHSSTPLPIPSDSAALSEVVSQGWAGLSRDRSPRGETALWLDSAPYLLIWQGTPERRAILVVQPESVFRQITLREDVSCTLADAEGRLVFGGKVDAIHATVRTPAETRLPWTLYVKATPPSAAGMVARQRFLILTTGVMVLILIVGFYLIARAIQTEAAVSRMQSDFVAAVSHEFRSPLTSMRQLSEMLALGRISNEERRQVYYDTLVRETVRLQRLVEGLLTFGRVEAGVRTFHLEETDVARLARAVAAEFEPQIAPAGRHIEVTHTGESCPIHADPEALTVAVRNLIDNAIKYAPGCSKIRVECDAESEFLEIRVHDSGPGILRSERRAIFRKFVRGSAAAAANVRGSGVGLATVRHIVALHRGRITVSGEPGKGSTFTIQLPKGARGI